MALILVFQNITALADVSDYRVSVLVGDGTPARSNVIASGVHKGHVRADGWERLVGDWLTERASSAQTETPSRVLSDYLVSPSASPTA